MTPGDCPDFTTRTDTYEERKAMFRRDLIYVDGIPKTYVTFLGHQKITLDSFPAYVGNYLSATFGYGLNFFQRELDARIEEAKTFPIVIYDRELDVSYLGRPESPWGKTEYIVAKSLFYCLTSENLRARILVNSVYSDSFDIIETAYTFLLNSPLFHRVSKVKKTKDVYHPRTEPFIVFTSNSSLHACEVCSHSSRFLGGFSEGLPEPFQEAQIDFFVLVSPDKTGIYKSPNILLSEEKACIITGRDE